MDQLRDFLEVVRKQGEARGLLRGLLHVLIGRRIELADGTLVSPGLNWRAAAALLKQVRWEPETVTELGLNVADLPMRDRERFWYAAITRSTVDSREALAAADRLARIVKAHGYVIGPAAGQG